MTPDFSPAMLCFFLRARVTFAHALRPSRFGPADTKKRELAQLRKASSLTHNQIDFAWMGRLRNADARVRLWAALGHFPADFGLLLDDDGGQRHA